MVFTSKELGVKNLGTYSKINLLVKRDDEDAAKVTVQVREIYMVRTSEAEAFLKKQRRGIR